MNVQTIEKSAKAIWELLHGKNKKWEYAELKDATGLSDRDLNAGIGWLAKEDKIYFEPTKDAGKEYLYLTLNYYIG